MPDERERRLAQNEAVFRVANERMDEWAERRAREDAVSYYCECSDIDCHDRIYLRVAEYERVRSDARHFAVAAGHEMLDVESVVERGDRHVIVEKDASIAPIVEATDPRGA